MKNDNFDPRLTSRDWAWIAGVAVMTVATAIIMWVAFAETWKWLTAP